MWCGLYKLELSEHGVIAITQACETENINKKAQVNVISKAWSVFVCFVALRLKSTAMVIAGRSVHLTTLFPGQA